MTFDCREYMKTRAKLVEQALEQYLPASGQYPDILFESMRYSVFAGGKRLRPILTLAVIETLGGDIHAGLPVACATELIHTYSLIHDDLPAMDNDDYRRGKPTNHKIYGDAIAILAGDGLLTLAFQVLSETKMPEGGETRLLQIIRELAYGAGVYGMVGGQVADLLHEGKKADENMLAFIHKHKTGALIHAAVRMGGLFAGATDEALSALSRYAWNMGLAFQIRDDILDIVGDTEKLGKKVGSDLVHDKSTYVSLYGLNESQHKVNQLTDEAHEALKTLPYDTTILHSIADYLMGREY
jgi:geranylgeranyl diphosphate synthase, type II